MNHRPTTEPTIRSSSAWTRPQITAFLTGTVIPIRIACLANDAPLISSFWYAYDGDQFWLATQHDAAVVAYLRDNERCGFEVSVESIPYRGVRGQGAARVDEKTGAATLEKLINRYLGDSNGKFANWLLSRAENEVAIVIQPDWMTSWDFSSRMVAGDVAEAADRG